MIPRIAVRVVFLVHWKLRYALSRYSIQKQWEGQKNVEMYHKVVPLNGGVRDLQLDGIVRDVVTVTWCSHTLS